ncbi:hypothetical protein GGD83_004638 [Rhodoblastus sphagnicola]|uniref:transporter n=1 Tax=Rhodoblastus sphagnicola TaxID=333368 RepID=UPI001304DC05|nr:transporter [Rhodoblastus sphagnicola]MBB4200809.1 hypothetical protein [Rhodoblastus sphagnicola]
MKELQYFVLIGAAAGVIGMAPIEKASAASFTQPGEQIGLATGSPVPEGLYFLDLLDYGNNRSAGTYDSGILVHIPALVWSTPWTLAGARVEFAATPPQIISSTSERGNKSNVAALSNPFAEIALAWDLGDGFGFTNYLGVYFPISNNGLNNDFWVFNERAAVSYVANGWNLSAYTATGITGANSQGQRVTPDYFNYDLTATKTLGKYIVGGGAFGSFDISGLTKSGYRRQSQFALAVLGGYNFASFTTMLYVSHDIVSANYTTDTGKELYETRVFARLIVPIWTPKSAVVTAKY